MGGSQFLVDGLCTPRIPPSTYNQAITYIQAQLPESWRVETCIEAPEKQDYGDIDLLILCSTADSGAGKGADLQYTTSLLGAGRFHTNDGNRVLHYAVPWREGWEKPSQESFAAYVTSHNLDPALIARFSAGEVDLHVQVDITFTRNERQHSYKLFRHAHGDLLNIISTMLRNKWLSITDTCLQLKVKDIAEITSDKKKATVCITYNPHEILSFLGLDPTRYFQPFTSKHQTMQYISTCQFFDPTYAEPVDDSLSTRYKFDQRHFRQRPMVRYWFEDFLPNSQHTPGIHADASYEKITSLLNERFPTTQLKISTAVYQAVLDRKKHDIWGEIHKMIMCSEQGMHLGLHRNEKVLGLFMRHLRRIVAPSHPNEQEAEAGEGAETEASAEAFKHERPALAFTDRSSIYARLRGYYQTGKFQFLMGEIQTSWQTLYSFYATEQDAAHARHKAGVKEDYSKEDDADLLEMKRDGMGWGEILHNLGKQSRSQVKARWKELTQEERVGAIFAED
ncbi:hypothetical protein LTR66_016831, partial [Elasticomyces elasticus]